MEKEAQINMDYVANLARLELSPEEKQVYAGQLSAVLDYFRKLDELDVSNVEPTAHATAVFNVWREDIPGPTFSREEALANAPAQRDGHVVVPRVVEE